MEASEKLPILVRGHARAGLHHTFSGRLSASRLLFHLYRIADIVIAIGSVTSAFIVTNLNHFHLETNGFLAVRVSVKNLLLMTIFALLWSRIYHAFGVYQMPRRRRDLLLRAAGAAACGGAMTLIFVVTSRAGLFGLDTAVLSWGIAICATVGTRMVFEQLLDPAALNHPRQVLIIGSGPRAHRLFRKLNNGACANYKVLGFIDEPNGHLPHHDIRCRTLGDLTRLEEILVRNVVDEVLITLPVKSCYSQIQNAISVAEKVGVEAKYLSDVFQPSVARVDHERLEGFPMTTLKPAVDDGRLMIKRAMDISCALTGLVLLSPLFALVAIAIRLTDGGPVIFNQERYGRNKRRFRMHKFRTMVPNAEVLQKDLENRNEAAGPVFKIQDDPRVTRLGRLLRRSSLDELPQLFNVLKGEMSLVGPRPLPLRDVLRFEESWLMRRFSITPGITGLWQVNGRSHMTFDKWVASDLRYIDDWSLMLDVKILMKTVPAVLRGSGAA